MRWGKAIAYNIHGKQIKEWSLRKIAGHSSVSFSFYKNGAIKKAYWSSAPDGGIQWYKSTTYFDENGKITREDKDSREGLNDPFNRKQLQQPTIKTQEVATCAVIYSSEYWFTNTTRSTVSVVAKHKYRNDESSSVILKPGATLKGGYLIEAERFVPPDKYFTFYATQNDRRRKKQLIVVSSHRKPENTTKESRKYFYEVQAAK